MGTSLRTVFWDREPVCCYATFWWRRAYALGMLARGGTTKLAGIDSCWGRNGKELQSWRCCEWIVRFLARRSKFISFSVPRIRHIWLHPWTWLIPGHDYIPGHDSIHGHDSIPVKITNLVWLWRRFLIMFPCKYCHQEEPKFFILHQWTIWFTMDRKWWNGIDFHNELFKWCTI